MSESTRQCTPASVQSQVDLIVQELASPHLVLRLALQLLRAVQPSLLARVYVCLDTESGPVLTEDLDQLCGLTPISTTPPTDGPGSGNTDSG